MSFMLAIAGSQAGIILDEPVIEMNGNEPSYLKFSGTNAENNYRFVLDTYGTDGVKFQLTLERIDALKPASFTAEDLLDENYWEPLFRKYTRELAGQEMRASENIKRLYVKDVLLQPGQFAGYGDALKEVYIEAKADYSIPDNCFARGGSEHYGLGKFDCKVEGILTLGDGILDASAGGLNIYAYREAIARQWFAYGQKENAVFTVWLNGERYVGTSDAPIGDLNGDGTVDVGDVTMLVGAILAGEQKTNMDLNADGLLDVGDVTTLVSRVLGAN